MKYFHPVEIHTHTNHSDGRFEPADLIQASLDLGYRAIALTDHNSASAYQVMEEAGLVDKELLVLKGMEWTTYLGHLLVIGADHDVDWRQARPTTIDDHLKVVKEASGVTVIAHPFDIGSPICTGCHWDFEVEDYTLVDYIEIYNSNHPQDKWESQAAYEWWRSLLDEGYKIGASCGRDWHGPDGPEENWALTYLATDYEALSKEDFKAALEDQATYLTLGPRLEAYLEDDTGQTYYSGDCVENKTSLTFKGNILPSEFSHFSRFNDPQAELVFIHRGQEINRQAIDTSKEGDLQVPLHNLTEGYLFWEIRGGSSALEDKLLLLANPIYLDFDQ